MSNLQTSLASVCLALLLGACASAEKKRISLSFDDAPRGKGPMFSGADRTDALIKRLQESDSGPVVFFVLTKGLIQPDNRARIAKYAEAGHLIANHTDSHPWLHKTKLDRYLHDIDRAETLLEGFSNRRNWFRFPYLDEGRQRTQRDAMRRALKERNLVNGYVTIDNYDWYLESKWRQAVEAGSKVDLVALRDVYLEVMLSATEFYQNVADQYLDRPLVHTLLLHENDLAALFVDDLIAALRKEGWQIVDPDTAYNDLIAGQEPDTLITSQGRVAALAIDAGAKPQTLTHLAIEEKQIDELLSRRKVFSN